MDYFNPLPSDEDDDDLRKFKRTRNDDNVEMFEDLSQIDSAEGELNSVGEKADKEDESEKEESYLSLVDLPVEDADKKFELADVDFLYDPAVRVSENERRAEDVDMEDVDIEDVTPDTLYKNSLGEFYGQCPPPKPPSEDQPQDFIKKVTFPTPAYYSYGFAKSLEKFLYETSKHIAEYFGSYSVDTVLGAFRCALRSYIYVVPPSKNDNGNSGILLWDPLFLFHEALCEEYTNFSDFNDRIEQLWSYDKYRDAILFPKPSNIAKILYNEQETGKLGYKVAFKIFTRDNLGWKGLSSKKLNKYLFMKENIEFLRKSELSELFNLKLTAERTDSDDLKNMKQTMINQIQILFYTMCRSKQFFFGGFEGFLSRLRKYAYENCDEYNVKSDKAKRVLKEYLTKIDIPSDYVTSFVDVIERSLMIGDEDIFKIGGYTDSPTILYLKTKIFIRDLLSKNKVSDADIKIFIGDVKGDLDDEINFNEMFREIFRNTYGSVKESAPKKSKTPASRNTRKKVVPIIEPEEEPEVKEAQPIVQQRWRCNFDDPIFIEIKCYPETKFIAGNFVTYADATCSFMPGFMVYSAKSCDEIKALVNEVLKDQAGDIHEPLKKKFEDKGYKTSPLFMKDLEGIGPRPGSFKVVKGDDVFFIIMGKNNQ